jgi:hypothetical protein
MVGFRPEAGPFFYYFLMIAASLLLFTAFGFLLVQATPMVELAQLFSGCVCAWQFVWSGVVWCGVVWWCVCVCVRARACAGSVPVRVCVRAWDTL